MYVNALNRKINYWLCVHEMFTFPKIAASLNLHRHSHRLSNNLKLVKAASLIILGEIICICLFHKMNKSVLKYNGIPSTCSQIPIPSDHSHFSFCYEGGMILSYYELLLMLLCKVCWGKTTLYSFI